MNCAVLVHSGCRNKMPQTEWFINNRKLLLSSGGQKSKIRVPTWSGEGPLTGCRLLIVASHGERVRDLSGASPVRVLFAFLKKIFIYLFIYLWLCWVFVSVLGLSPVAASGGHSSSRCTGLSPSQPLLLRSTGSRRAGSAVVAHGPSRSAACGIFPDQGSNPCPLHWQADSQPLHHQGSPHKGINLILEGSALMTSSPPKALAS